MISFGIQKHRTRSLSGCCSEIEAESRHRSSNVLLDWNSLLQFFNNCLLLISEIMMILVSCSKSVKKVNCISLMTEVIPTGPGPRSVTQWAIVKTFLFIFCQFSLKIELLFFLIEVQFPSLHTLREKEQCIDQSAYSAKGILVTCFSHFPAWLVFEMRPI